MSLHLPLAHQKEQPPKQKLNKGRTGAKDRFLALLAVCGCAGPVLYVVTWILAGLLYPGYNQLTQATSELTSRAAPPAAAAVANVGGIVLSLSVIALALGLYLGVRRSPWLLIGSVLLGLFGLVCLGQLLFPRDPGVSPSYWQNVMHGVMFVLSGITLTPGLLVLFLAFTSDPDLRSYRWYTLCTPLLMLLASQATAIGILPAGVPERLANLVVLTWIEVVSIRLLWLALKHEPGPDYRDE